MIDDSTYSQIQKLIEKVILIKYPFIKLKKIDSYKLTNNEEFDVYFITKNKLEDDVQESIDTDVKSLFKMASLDIKGKGPSRDKIMVWFKTPRAKEYSFKAKQGYKHS